MMVVAVSAANAYPGYEAEPYHMEGRGDSTHHYADQHYYPEDDRHAEGHHYESHYAGEYDTPHHYVRDQDRYYDNETAEAKDNAYYSHGYDRYPVVHTPYGENIRWTNDNEESNDGHGDQFERESALYGERTRHEAAYRNPGPGYR